MPDRTQLRAELADLLARAVEARRLGLSLGPRERERLKSLLLTLGLWKGAIPMSRRKLTFAKSPAAPQPTYPDFINHAGAALDNPMDNAAVLAMADHLADAHPGDRHAEAFIRWANGEATWPQIAPVFQHAPVKPVGEPPGHPHEQGGPYIQLAPSPYRYRGPGAYPPGEGYGSNTDSESYATGRITKRAADGFWAIRRRRGARMVEVPGTRMSGPDVAQHLYDVDGIRSLLLAVIGSRHFHPERYQGPGAPVSFRRKLKFAKAEKTRHPAHPLVAGFPLEHALRHLANDPDNSPTLRQTAFVALTGRKGDTVSPEGHPEALWALNDLLQEHENKDGTTGHPLAKAYNWMSAADKVVLDRHTRQALVEAANDEKVGVPHTHHDHWEYTPDEMAVRAGRALDKRPGEQATWARQRDNAMLARVVARVRELAPYAKKKDIHESVRRHSYRSMHTRMLFSGIPTDTWESRALRHPDWNDGQARSAAHDEELATRYGRRLNSVTVTEYPRKYGAETTEDDFHRLLDANPDDHHTRLVFADWLQDRGDPRAEGYRALGMLRKQPFHDRHLNEHSWTYDENEIPISGIHRNPSNDQTPVGVRHGLPRPWLNVVDGNHYSALGRLWTNHDDRRSAEDAAANAFSQLPSEEQQRITQQPQQMSRRRYLKPRTDFIDALHRTRSSQMAQLRKAAKVVATKLGFKPVSTASALHDSPQGSVPGIAQALYGTASPESVHQAASWSGLTANLPGVQVFHPRPRGPDRLYRVRVAGSGLDLRQKLDRYGITDRVLIPHRAGYDVLVADAGAKLGQAVQAFAQAGKHQLQASAGFLHVIGNADRGEARADFRDQIVQGEGQQRKKRGKPRRYSMATEDDFHRHLDANPDDHHARMVFADWLEEQGDPRAAGYRALGMLKRSAYYYEPFGTYPHAWRWGNADNTTPEYAVMSHFIPQDWLSLITDQRDEAGHPLQPGTVLSEGYWRVHPSRRAADDSAALGFSQLPPDRQKELLKSPQQMSRVKRRLTCRS